MSFLSEIYKFKNRTAIISKNDIKISYGELYKISNKLVRDISPRSLIFLLAGNNIETIFYYVGLVNANSVITMLDKDINEKNLKKLIIKYKPNYLILPSRYHNITGYIYENRFYNYKILEKKNNKKIIIYDELAILLNTSGSTGSSKLVRQSYQNYIENSKSIVKMIGINFKDSVITTLPMSYTFGSSIINTHLISGSKIILNEYPILQKNFPV